MGDWAAGELRASSAASVTTPITLAVVDDAVDTRHPEFADRVVGEWDPAAGVATARPQGWEPHGTKVAGLALAGGNRVTGVAPSARLLAVRVSGLGTSAGVSAEGDAIRWAAQRGADVICCAWGPHDSAVESLPDRTRAALDWAITHGRGGRGCVVVFSAGNDGSDLALNGYASHPGVMAVGACSSLGRRTHYSGWGDALWCVVESNEPRDPVGAHSTYTTTTPMGSFLLGNTFYTHDFGFTSAACAIAAGACARILAANPDLTSAEVKAVVAETCEKIDLAGGSYDASGHSPYYGFGRLDLARAIARVLAKNEAPSV